MVRRRERVMTHRGMRGVRLDQGASCLLGSGGIHIADPDIVIRGDRELRNMQKQKRKMGKFTR
jgi:hypothetical protein